MCSAVAVTTCVTEAAAPGMLLYTSMEWQSYSLPPLESAPGRGGAGLREVSGKCRGHVLFSSRARAHPLHCLDRAARRLGRAVCLAHLLTHRSAVNRNARPESESPTNERAAEVAQAAAELASKQVAAVEAEAEAAAAAAAAAKSFSGRLQRSCRVTSEPAHAPCLLLLRPPPTPFGGSHSPIEAETGPRRRGRAVDVAVGAGAGGGGSDIVSEQQPWQSHPNKWSVAQVAVRLISPHVACPQAVRHASGGGGGGAIDLQ